MKLEIKNISKIYPNGVQALKDISFTVGKGMFGLLGPNGAGKSTLMRTIATLQDADQGQILFNGLDVEKEPHEIRKTLGYLPQEFGIYPTVSAEELLLHIADMKGIVDKIKRKQEVAELLNRVNLYEVRKKHLGSYSGGMKQRFGIAQALIGNPKLIVVDEPTAGLDPMERNRFYNFLSQIGEDIIVILSTHIVEDVSTLCSNMAVIGKGSLLINGKPNEIINNLRGKVYQVSIEKIEAAKYREKYNVLYENFYFGKLILTIFSEKENISNLKIKEPTLEDVYFSLLAQGKIEQ